MLTQLIKVHFKKEVDIFNERDNDKKKILVEEHLKQINLLQDKILEEFKSDNHKKEVITKEALLLSEQITSKDIDEACSELNPPEKISYIFKFIVLLFDLENNVDNKDES